MPFHALRTNTLRTFALTLLCTSIPLAAVEATVQVVEPNEFHLDVASASTSGTATTTLADGTEIESDIESEGTRFSLGFLREAGDGKQPVALLLGLDLVLFGTASSEMGVDTTMMSMSVNGALGVRFGAGGQRAFVDLLANLGLGMTAFESTGSGFDSTGTLGRFLVGASVRPGIWLDSGHGFGLYGLLGVETATDAGTITTTTGFGSSNVDYTQTASSSYIGLGFAGRF